MNKRQSNIELLRLIAMLLVLIVHANLMPTASELTDSPFTSFWKIFIDELSCVCVNVFILISGWFGIKPTYKGLLNIIFQSIFCSLIVVSIALMLGFDGNYIYEYIKSFVIGENYWFVSSYIVLYICAPILNAFIEHIERRSIIYFLIFFFIVQTYFDTILSIGGFGDGCSPLSFFGLYLLARFINRYPTALLNGHWHTDLLKYVGVSLISTLIIIGALLSKSDWIIGNIQYRFLKYSNPLIIIAALYLMLAFTKIKIKNSATIQYLSISCFSIYLLHCHPLIFSKYKNFMYSIYSAYDGLLCIIIWVCGIFAIALSCILIDKIRLLLWNKIVKFIPQKNLIS